MSSSRSLEFYFTYWIRSVIKTFSSFIISTHAYNFLCQFKNKMQSNNMNSQIFTNLKLPALDLPSPTYITMAEPSTCFLDLISTTAFHKHYTLNSFFKIILLFLFSFFPSQLSLWAINIYISALSSIQNPPTNWPINQWISQPTNQNFTKTSCPLFIQK